MSSRIVAIGKKIKSYLLLEDRIPVYLERADYFRGRAILESIKSGVRVDRNEGVELIDVAETTAITLPDKSKVEFARDKNDIYFARIEGSKFYPIDIVLAEELLDQSREYEILSQSFWRRYLRGSREEFLESLKFELRKIPDNISDSTFQLNFMIQYFTSELRGVVEDFRSSVVDLEQKVKQGHKK